MLNNDSVQTHQNSNQDEDFDFTQSPKPNAIIVTTSTASQDHVEQSSNSPPIAIPHHPSSYHSAIHHPTKRRLRKMLFPSMSFLSPPQNRLAFINAVRTAWSLHANKEESPRKSKPDKHTVQIKKQHHHHANQKKLFQRAMAEQHMSQPNEPCTIKNKADYPPITAEALSELSVTHLFKSLQIRHDLLIDPHLTFRPNLTTEKAQESETYWYRLDQLIRAFVHETHQVENNDDYYQLLLLIRNLITELSQILISLTSPFPSHPTTSVTWHWPQHVTEATIMAALDPDLIQQQLMQGCFDIYSTFDFLLSILNPLCSEQADKIQTCVVLGEYAKALELCFLTLETIKLDCANKALHSYRLYLIETGTSIEWNLFLKQLDQGEVDTSSVSEWMVNSWKRIGSEAKFIQAFRSGIIDLMTDDSDTIKVLQLSPTSFPITFSYDEKRLKHQMRHEFQNIIVIGLLLMPYRLMAGRKATRIELNQLKSVYSKLLRDASVTSGRVSCFHLALHACNIVRQRHKTRLIPQDAMVEQARYWSNWMNQNLRSTSPVYQVMYHRVRSILLYAMSRGSFEEQDIQQQHATIGLEQEIGKLSEKLSLIADYNMRTFGSLYTYLLPSVRNKIS
ncbi:T-complex protein 11-domain-containing protein [Blakeslea trispora]|nr:T-complex protein 11-domain-containing protein [Blakeslea trispora]